MPRYLIRRLRYSVLLLWGVATLVFLLFNVLPAGRTQSTRAEPSLWLHYGLYLNDLSPLGITGSGISDTRQCIRLTRLADGHFLSLKAPFFRYSDAYPRQRVGDMLGRKLPATLMLVLTVMVIAILLGCVLGFMAALKKSTLFDGGAIAAAITGISLTPFLAGLLIACIAGFFVNSFLCAAVALSIRPMAVVLQLSRSVMLEVLNQNYIRSAYARGLGTTRVVLCHALPNALAALLKTDTGWLSELLTGCVFVEYIFNHDGLGKLSIDAIGRSDISLVMGAMLCFALIWISVNLLKDILIAWLDPGVSCNQQPCQR